MTAIVMSCRESSKMERVQDRISVIYTCGIWREQRTTDALTFHEHATVLIICKFEIMYSKDKLLRSILLPIAF